MAETTFRTSNTPEIGQEASRAVPKDPSNTGAESDFADIAPIEDISQSVLSSIGIEDSIDNMPAEDAQNILETGSYIMDIIDAKGLKPTESNVTKTIDSIMDDMGLSEDMEPSIILDRIGGVVKSWKKLSFINDPSEKRRIFMKLGKLGSGKEMNEMVFNLMEKKSVWQ